MRQKYPVTAVNQAERLATSSELNPDHEQLLFSSAANLGCSQGAYMTAIYYVGANKHYLACLYVVYALLLLNNDKTRDLYGLTLQDYLKSLLKTFTLSYLALNNDYE